jgi:hypothetical protein
MFLLFGLKRMDVFSLGDLGIQRGQAVIAGRDVGKLKSGGKGKWKYMSEEDMIKHSEPFRPYRSTFLLLYLSARLAPCLKFCLSFLEGNKTLHYWARSYCSSDLYMFSF